MCAVKQSCVLKLIQKYQPVKKEEIRLIYGGQRCIKHPFLLTKGKCFPVLAAMAHAQCCTKPLRIGIHGGRYDHWGYDCEGLWRICKHLLFKEVLSDLRGVGIYLFFCHF
jgi:hypothetical protein